MLGMDMQRVRRPRRNEEKARQRRDKRQSPQHDPLRALMPCSSPVYYDSTGQKINSFQGCFP